MTTMKLRLGALAALLLSHSAAAQESSSVRIGTASCPANQTLVLQSGEVATLAPSVGRGDVCGWELKCADAAAFVQLTFTEFNTEGNTELVTTNDGGDSAPIMEVLPTWSTAEPLFSLCWDPWEGVLLGSTYDFFGPRCTYDYESPSNLLTDMPVNIRSSSVAVRLTACSDDDGDEEMTTDDEPAAPAPTPFGGGAVCPTERVRWITATATCVERMEDTTACPAGSIRQYPWLSRKKRDGATGRLTTNLRPPPLSPLLFGSCEKCPIEERCTGEDGGCSTGAWGRSCHQCECDLGDEYGIASVNTTHCYYAGKGGQCAQCAEEGPGRWAYDLGIAFAFIGVLLLAPAAVWKLSKHKGDAIDLTVKETKVAQDAALRAAAVAGEAAKVSAAVNAMSSSAAASAATVATSANTAAAVLPHVQMVAISIEVDMDWPEFMTDAARWLREIVLFDFLSAMDSACTAWRSARDSVMNACDLTAAIEWDHAAVIMHGEVQSINVEAAAGVCITRPTTGACPLYGREQCSTSPDQNYTLDDVFNEDGYGAVWRQTGMYGAGMYGAGVGRPMSLGMTDLAPWHDGGDKPQWLEKITDLSKGPCTTDADCATMDTMVHTLAGEMNGPGQVITQLWLKLSVFAAIVAVFVLLIYVPAGCVPDKHWPEKRLGSRDEVRQHAINAVAATHSLLIMVIAKACFTATDVSTANDGSKYLASSPDANTSGSSDDKTTFFIVVLLGWLTTIIVVIAPPIWYYQKLRAAGRLVARWEAKDRRTAFCELLQAVPAEAEESDNDSDGVSGGLKHTERDLQELAVNQLRAMCEDEKSIEQHEIDAADAEQPTIMFGRERWFLDFQRSYGYLFSKYDPWAWWYEAVASARKVLLVCFSVLLSEWQVLYATSSLVTVAYALRVQLKYKPFLDGMHTLVCTPIDPDQVKVQPCASGHNSPGPTRCKSVTKLSVGAILPLSYAFGFFGLLLENDKMGLLTDGNLGTFLTLTVVLAYTAGAYCVGKLLSLWYDCTRKKARYEIIIGGQTIAVDDVPDGVKPEVVTTAQVLRRDHVNEDASDSDADSADTLEQTSLMAQFVLLLMGLLTHLVNLLQTTDEDIEADSELKKSPVIIVITIALSCIAVVAVGAPFAERKAMDDRILGTPSEHPDHPGWRERDGLVHSV
eukprot:COSAG06_NODE_4142_length_4531_cov_19.196977_1_plen_1158_part_10